MLICLQHRDCYGENSGAVQAEVKWPGPSEDCMYCVKVEMNLTSLGLERSVDVWIEALESVPVTLCLHLH